MIHKKISEVILKTAERGESFTVNDVLKALNNQYTRAYVLRFINQLISEKRIVKSGSTRSATYAGSQHIEKLGTQAQQRYANINLKEDKILLEFESRAAFLRNLPENIQSVFEYAFSEMVNNAIEHSKSQNIDVKVEKEGKTIRFYVDDFGIGVFRNVMNERRLHSELEAIQDLLKGKTTTNPHAHSGEGIFFTSKVGDIFVLDSYGYELRVDNIVNDVFISESKRKKNGTCVIFEISEDHKGHLDDVFKKYYTDLKKLAFDKTEVRIKLYTRGSIYISRSQARRVLVNLEKFKSIVLDFDKVPGVGQAFADEIFRVFKTKNPDIQITPVNMNDSVAFMVKRVAAPKLK